VGGAGGAGAGDGRVVGSFGCIGSGVGGEREYFVGGQYSGGRTNADHLLSFPGIFCVCVGLNRMIRVNSCLRRTHPAIMRMSM
jgi:hypothetical protein